MESPLKESDLKTINKSLYLLNELIEAMDKAECAGIDCSEQKLRREDLTAKLLAIKNAYFPGR